MTPKVQRTALLVLGMHRSGTSALTRVMSLMGYALPKSVAMAGNDNETGHWESASVAGMSDGVFDELGMKWFSWEPIQVESLGSLRKSQIIGDFAATIEADFPAYEDFVLKDPRTCRLTSIIIPALNKIKTHPKIIIPIRNPLEVASSLEKRDGISKGQAVLLWLRYVLDAEYGSRGHDRVFIRYDDLLDDTNNAISKIISTLALKPKKVYDLAKKDIERFLNPHLKHHDVTIDQVYLDPETKGWVSRALDSLLTLTDLPNDTEAMSSLDRVKNELDNASPLLQKILNTVYSEKSTLVENLTRDLESEKAEYNSELQILKNQLTEKDATYTSEIQKLNELIIQKNADYVSEVERIKTLLSEKENQATKLQSTSTEHDSMVEELNSREKVIHELKSKLDSHETNLQTIHTLTQELEAHQSDFSSHQKKWAAEKNHFNDELKKHHAELAAKTAEHESAILEVKNLLGRLDQIESQHLSSEKNWASEKEALSNALDIEKQKNFDHITIIQGLKDQITQLEAAEKQAKLLNVEMSELSHKMKLSASVRNALAEEVSMRDERIIQLEGEISQLTSTLRLRGEEFTKLKDAEKKLKFELKTISEDAKNKLKKADGRTAKLVADLTNAQDTITSLTHANNATAATLSSLEAQRNALQDNQSNFQLQLKNLELEKVRLENEYAALKDHHAKLGHEKTQLENHKQKLESEKHQLEIQKHQLENEKEQTAQTTKGLQNEIQHLRERLAQEQRTVLKPAIRRTRSAVGKALRLILPGQVVNKMAFAVPTSEQKQILKMKAIERNNTSNLLSQINTGTHTITATVEKPDVFIFAIIGWHFRMQRPQHIARELSELGHRVFYFEMDPPGLETEIEQINPRLMRIKLKLDGPPQIQAYTGTPSKAQQKAWLKAFYGFCDTMNASHHKELIIQHPFWWQLAKLLPPEFRTFYDCMDDIAGFDNSTQELIDLEHAFLDGVDDLVVSSTTLSEKYKAHNPLDIIRNATELAPFLKPDLSALTDQYFARPMSGKIKVGYVGAISDWFDTELLKAVARSRPDIEFHLCGNVSVEHPKALSKEPNIAMYGEIPYVQVPAFLNQMDVLIIPFRIIPIIQACDPVKFYEYSALGKPTVTTPLPELDRAKHLAFFADGPTEFAQQIDHAFKAKDDEQFIEEMQEFAAQNTWTHRAAQMSKVINSYPKISVIILAYGEPELTNATLHSLMGKSPIYPNMEILIVDNGSSRDALDNMYEFAEKYNNTRIIENGENLGFAEGNNVGLKEAKGDYVLLLNNDTYVSPGALYGMMRHLQKHSHVGAVGPLTNNIGNEAKVLIEYESMNDMISKSRALTTGYRGKHIPTRVVAYFAVMFRKADLTKFGLLSTDYGRGMFEDDDHCHKIKQEGYDCIVAEDAFVHHHLSATFSTMDDAERTALFNRNKATFEEKWGPWQPHQYRENRQSSDLLFPNDELY